MSSSKHPARFSIAYRDGAYHVSIPDYEGGEVVRADVADELVEALRACRDLFSDIRNDWTDPRSECRQGWAIIDAAIAKAEAA